MILKISLSYNVFKNKKILIKPLKKTMVFFTFNIELYLNCETISVYQFKKKYLL